MKKSIFIFAIMTLFTLGVNGQTKKDGTPDMRYSSNKSNDTYSTPKQSSTNNSGSRPVYSGQTHTESHGGKYVGQQNAQTHKGGTYTNAKSNNNYGTHKRK